MTGRGVYSLATGWVVLDLAAVQEVVLETGLLNGRWVRLLAAY